MSDTAPRRIGGLTPRRETAAPLSRLVKAERDRGTTPAAPANPPAPAAPAPPTAPVEDAAPTVAPRPAPVTVATTDGNVAVTFRLPFALRDRSRAVFKATRTLENDDTYSHMVAKAIENELRRREALYNDGQPYGGGEAKLASGRPFAG